MKKINNCTTFRYRAIIDPMLFIREIKIKIGSLFFATRVFLFWDRIKDKLCKLVFPVIVRVPTMIFLPALIALQWKYRTTMFVFVLFQQAVILLLNTFRVYDVKFPISYALIFRIR